MRLTITVDEAAPPDGMGVRIMGMPSVYAHPVPDYEGQSKGVEPEPARQTTHRRRKQLSKNPAAVAARKLRASKRK